MARAWPRFSTWAVVWRVCRDRLSARAPTLLTRLGLVSGGLRGCRRPAAGAGRQYRRWEIRGAAVLAPPRLCSALRGDMGHPFPPLGASGSMRKGASGNPTGPPLLTSLFPGSTGPLTPQGGSASPSRQVPDSSLAGGRRHSTTFSTPLRAKSAPPEARRPARVPAAYSAVPLAAPQASSQPARAAPRTLSEVLAMGMLMLLRALRRRVEMVSFSSDAIWGCREEGQARLEVQGTGTNICHRRGL